MTRLKLKTLTISCALMGLIVLTPANASFLEDMYQDVSANANVNAPDAYSTQTMGVVSGGGMVWKSPVKTFTPFSFTPPSLKGGCGGIDAFMGAFGFVNKDEFIQMLKAVGQNAAGLLFQMALKAMSPELSSEIENFSKTIQEWTRKYQNSCETAKLLVDGSGAGEIAAEMGRTARRFGVAAGIFADDADAEKDTATNGVNIETNLPLVTNSGGKKITDKDINITWAALNSGTFSGFSTSDLEIIQALLGTVVIKWIDDGDGGRIPQPTPVPATALSVLDDWIGKSDGATVFLPSYICDDNPDDCLTVLPTTSTAPERTLANRVYRLMNELRAAINERRTPVTIDGLDPLSVIGMTSVPIGRIINIAATTRYNFLGDHLIKNYSEVVAAEIALRIMSSVLLEADKAIANQKLMTSDAIGQLNTLRAHVSEMGVSLSAKQRDLDSQIANQGILVAQIEQMEKSLYTGLSLNVVNSLRFNAVK